MSETFTDRTPETAGLEVQVFRDGRLVHRELCETDEDAALAVDEWSELEGVECRVRDPLRSDAGSADGAEPEEPLGAEAEWDGSDGAAPAPGRPTVDYWE